MEREIDFEDNQDLTISLIENRVAVFEGYAQDSLAILSLQALILPITLSAASLFSGVPALHLASATVFAGVSVVLTIVTYYSSKRTANRFRNMILKLYTDGSEWGIPEEFGKYRTQFLEDIQIAERYIDGVHEKYFPSVAMERKILQDFNNIKERSVRLRLFLSLVFSISSVAISTYGFVDTSVDGLGVLAVGIAFFAVIILLTTWFYLNIFALIGRNPKRVSAGVLILGWYILKIVWKLMKAGVACTYRLSQKVVRSTKRNPTITVTGLLYLFLPSFLYTFNFFSITIRLFVLLSSLLVCYSTLCRNLHDTGGGLSGGTGPTTT